MSNNSEKTKNLKELVQEAGSRRLINAEYRRGFMEGYNAATIKMVGCIDELLHKHDHIASLPTDWDEFYLDLLGEEKR